MIYRFPDGHACHFKQLVKAMDQVLWTTWHTYLTSLSEYESDVLISAEQFGPRLTQRASIQKLKSIAEQYGYRLTVVIFIRSQLDYINSRYGYSLKRFYHHDTFATYVEKILNNKSPLKQGSGATPTNDQTSLTSGIIFQPCWKSMNRDWMFASSPSARPTIPLSSSWTPLVLMLLCPGPVAGKTVATNAQVHGGPGRPGSCRSASSNTESFPEDFGLHQHHSQGVSLSRLG